jgi:hypothetical protein
MTPKELTRPERIKGLLQPDVVIPLNQTVAGPLDLLWLREALAERLRPPATSEGSVQRMVRFKLETWAALTEMAERLQAEGTSASPTRLAALLVEAGLAQLQAA